MRAVTSSWLRETEREGRGGTEGDEGRPWFTEKEGKSIKNTEKPPHEREAQRPKSPFLPFIILSPAIVFVSSLHSQKTNKSIRDSTGWREK